jgi:predicted membrane GTPase involved in stress response
LETGYIIAINGLVSGTFSFIAYKQSQKKNRNDFINNQISSLESDINSIVELVYQLYDNLDSEDRKLDENIIYRLLIRKTSDLQSKILGNNFYDFEEIVVDFNIYTTTVVESEDKDSAKSNLNIFDDIQSEFKEKIYKMQGNINK